MNRLAASVCFILLGAAPLCGQSHYEKFFNGATLRVDLYHTGTKGEERFTLDRAIQEGAWPGHRVNLVDTLNLGEYLLAVTDHATNALLYSRGFSSLFNEWQTTDEALAGVHRTFSESVRFPFPGRAFRLSLSRRDRRMEFHEVFAAVIDPADPTQVMKESPAPRFAVSPVIENGPPSVKVDIVVMGDGYAAADMEKFRGDVRRFVDTMFRTHPFRERKSDFNVWRVDVASEESGIDVPDRNVWKRNALGTKYNTFGSPRYVLTEENRTIRDIASAAPYDFICILVNDSRYGGGGIYNLYATTYANESVAGYEWLMDYVFVHEFGHSFAGLADEYYTSTTAYNDFYVPGIEPWEPNVTAHAESDRVKWKSMLTAGIPVPTYWEKQAYDSVEAIWGKLDRLAPDYYRKWEPLRKSSTDILGKSKYAGSVGVFEGAGYASKGLYRPSVDCRMFSPSLVDFDPVCSAAIERMIDFYADPGGK